MATLYASENGTPTRKPKLSVMEMMMYNMASMLAGVAAGYDVRMSNVSALHPKLQQQIINPDLLEARELEEQQNREREFVRSPEKGYSNTYHGPVRHVRWVEAFLLIKNYNWACISVKM